MKYYILFLFVLVTLNSFGKDDYKYGKVTIEELSEKYYKKDSLTGAVILYNIGETETTLHHNTFSFNTTYTVRKKIKIYDKNALGLANLTLVLYDEKLANQDISIYNVKGKTYNLENGKIVDYDLPKSAVRIDRLDDYHVIVHIPFTNVKEGSVIEYEITLNIPGIGIQDWYFQENYPVEYSQYTVNMAELFSFRQSTKGYLQIPLPETSSRKGIFVYNYNSIEYKIDIMTWKMKNIPAFVEEPYIYCPDNYRTQINHELLSIKPPRQIEIPYTTNWNEVIKNLLEHKYHGQLLKGSSSYLTTEYDKVKDIKDNFERMKACYTEIQKSMSWNFGYNIYSLSLKDAHKETKGNAADINFLLLRLLKDCNIESYPVIISTRDNGFVPMFPSLKNFNYLIVCAKMNGQSYLLDATDKYLPPNILPTRCLNEKGLVIKEGTTVEWVNLSPKQNSTILNSTEIKLNDDGSINGKSTYKRTGYAALDVRHDLAINTSPQKQEWITKAAKNGIVLLNYTVANKDSITLPIVESFEFKLDNSTTENNKTTLFDPILFEKMADNPFKNPERVYPVEFPTTIDKTYIVNIALPDNISIDEKPKNIAINMPDNSAKFTYQINLVGNTIQLNAKLNIKNILYSQEQYPYLKEFYTQVISKLNEPILLQRK